MKSSRRGTFPSRSSYQDPDVEFFPRGRNDSRRTREASSSYSHSDRLGSVGSGYARSGRDPGYERRKDIANDRIRNNFSQNNERRESQYGGRERSGLSYDGRNYGPSGSNSLSYSTVSTENRVPAGNDSRYKYLNEGWYNDYKTAPLSGSASNPQMVPYGSRDYPDSRNGFASKLLVRENVERMRDDKSSHSGPGPSRISKYSYASSSIVRETLELEQRMAAIQRELDMLETDKKGSRSPDYQRVRSEARRERRTRREAHSPSRSSSNKYSQRPNEAEQARLEREQENLRRRERELARREEELKRKERQLRERTPPRPVRTTSIPPRHGNLLRRRHFESHPRISVRSKRIVRILDNTEVRLPQKRRVFRTREVSVREDSRPPLKRRIETKREYKEEQDVTTDKTTRKEEADSLSEQALKKLVDRTIGPEELDDYEPPRQRAIAQLLSLCDKKLLSEEVLRKFGVVEAEIEPIDKDNYKKQTCIRTHNPTTFGPLDQFVPLRSFEEEVVIEPSHTVSKEVL